MIDQQRLQELADDFGAEELAELIESFLEEAAETVQALEATVSDVHIEVRCEHFHFLKGCALNVGAMELAKVCESYEHSKEGFSTAQYMSVKADFEAVKSYFANGGLQNVA